MTSLARLRPLLFALVGSSAVIVGVLAWQFAGETGPGTFDQWADSAISARVPLPGGTPFDLIEIAGDPVPAATLTVLLAGFCRWLGHRDLAWTTFLGVALTGVATTALKPLTGRTIHGDNLCFPSGHTAALTALGMALGLLMVRRWEIDSGPAALLVTLAFAATTGTAIALLLVTDGIHYTTDTIGGFFTALAVVAAVALAVDRRSARAGVRQL